MPKHVDFQRLIEDLLIEMTQVQIAEAVGCTQGTVSALYRGYSRIQNEGCLREPRYHLGAALIELHKKVCK